MAVADEVEDGPPFDMRGSIEPNRLRLEQRSASAAGSGRRWSVEFRDQGDAFDADAGEYFGWMAPVADHLWHPARGDPA